MTARPLIIVCVLAAVSAAAACSSDVNGEPQPRAEAEGDASDGRRLIASYGCGACHTIPGVPGADAAVGPPLNRFYERAFIAGALSNTEDNLIQWIQDPQAVEPGTAMPDLGVSAGEARDIAAYLYQQPAVSQWLRP